MTALSRLRLCPRQHFDKTEMLLENQPWHVDWFQGGPPRAVQGAPSPLAGEGVVAEQRRMRGSLGARQLREAPINSPLRQVSAPPPAPSRLSQARSATEEPESLVLATKLTVFVGKALLRDFMAWTVNFDNQPMFEAHEIKDIVAKGNLPLELGAVASPVANCAPNKCLGLNGPRARSRANRRRRDRGISCAMTVASQHSSRVEHTEPSPFPHDPPHPSLLRNDTFPHQRASDRTPVFRRAIGGRGRGGPARIPEDGVSCPLRTAPPARYWQD
jgi:hypothetical protein